MQVETLEKLASILWIVAGVLFLLAVTLFFVFRVPYLFSEISGSAKRKRIAEISSEKGQQISYKKMKERRESEFRKTFAASAIPTAVQSHTAEVVTSAATGELPMRKPKQNTSPETTLLRRDGDEESYQQTTILRTESAQTTILREQDAGGQLPILCPNTPFRILEEFRFTSSQETV